MRYISGTESKIVSIAAGVRLPLLLFSIVPHQAGSASRFMAETFRGGAAVLAGGRSLRMGQDKATLLVEGTTLLSRTAQMLQTLADPVIIVESAPNSCELKNVRTIPDRCPGAGPLGGIITALYELGEGAHLVVACDLPFLNPVLLRMLQDLATEEFDAVVPSINERLEPLCAVYDYSSLRTLEAFVHEGGRAVHIALGQIHTRVVHESDLRRCDPELKSFVNLNTPDDVRQWIGPR